MSGRTTSEATPNAISSQASAGGPSLLDWLDGQTIDRYGPEVPHASRTPSAALPMAERKAKVMHAISGRISAPSSASVSLQMSLESRLRQAIAWGWWDEVCWDLEAAGYACAAAVVPACAVEGSHERKRLVWLAHSCSSRRPGHQQVERLPVAASAALSVYGDPLADAWRALDGDYSHLLPSDGLSVAVERLATHGYGNAIVPQVAAEVIGAYLEAAA